MVISGHQWSSVVISGHQARAEEEATSIGHTCMQSHQWSSVVISGHQWSLVVISGHQARAEEEA
jgi:hypothetical protein